MKKNEKFYFISFMIGIASILLFSFICCSVAVVKHLKDDASMTIDENNSSTEIKEEIFISDEELQKECEEYNIAFTFVKAVIETDSEYDAPLEEDIVEELYNYFVKYEDPYLVLLCHRYGEEEAKEIFDFNGVYIENTYVDKVFEKEKILN